MPFVPDKPAQAAPTGGRFVPDAPAEARPDYMAEVAAETPEWERRAAAVGRSMAKPFEALEQLGENVTGGGAAANEKARKNALAMEALYRESPAARKTGIATDITTGFLLPGAAAGKGATALDRILAGMTTGGLYSALEPVTTGGKDFGKEKAQQAATGSALGAGLTGVLETLNKIPGAVDWIKKILPGGKGAPEAPGPKGVAAERVTDELQRIRDTMEGKLTQGPNIPSGYEAARKTLEDATTPLREAAFASGKTVDVDRALKMIERMESQNVDKNVLAALKQAKDTLSGAVEKSGPGVEIIKTSSGDKMIRNGRLVPVEKSFGASMPMADEVRQSLERQIQARPEGQPLSEYTQKLLREVKDAVTAKAREASKDYAQYLDEYAKNAKALEKFAPEQTVLGKVTSADAGFQKLTGGDAQRALEKAFSGDRVERDLAGLVENTKHNPEVLKSLRGALGEYLTKPDPKTMAATSGDILKRWDKVGDAAEKSGLITKDHADAINKVMQEMRVSESASTAKKAAASVAGYIIGGMKGHPIAGMHLAQQATSRKGTEQAQKAIASLVAGDETAAKLLSAPPTKENISKAMEMLEKSASAVAGRESAEQRPKKRVGELTQMPRFGMVQ